MILEPGLVSILLEPGLGSVSGVLEFCMEATIVRVKLGVRCGRILKLFGCGKLFCLCDVYWLVVSAVCVCVGGSEADELPALFCGVSLQITETRA